MVKNFKMKTLSIIIPVFNECKTIVLLLDKIIGVKLQGNISKDIIIINDGSSDETNDIIIKYISENKFLNIRLISHDTNKGKGASIYTGIKLAIGEFLIIQDADLEYDPEEYNILM